MQLIDGQIVLSATDLIGFLACQHLPGLELAAAARLVERPVRPDAELDLIQRRGLQHESRYLGDLEAQGRRVTRVEADREITQRGQALRRAAVETEAAIRRGDDAIYQATFFDGRWVGYADFLVRVEDPSPLGPWGYEVVDTKLARHTKASALLQICSYVDALTRVQGAEPLWMHVALAGQVGSAEHYRVADFMAFYRFARRLLEERVAQGAPEYPPRDTYPEPVEHCEVCRWDELCSGRRRRDDDISLVAGIATRHARELKSREIRTRRGLAGLETPLRPPLEETRPPVLERLHRQARLQVEGEDAGRPLYELIEPVRLEDGRLEPDRGLLSLPEPRHGDLFFDIEGDPFAFDGGLDYLFGVLEPGLQRPDEGPAFHALWAREADGRVTSEAEKEAFERLMDLFMDRLARDPEIHIYHYAPYEPSALGRLMGRHGTREDDVDRLLRGGVLVDLYRAVRQGVRASAESYSIKRLEPLYGFKREVDLRDAGASIAAFEEWLELGGEAGGHDDALHRIERYNQDDVVSTMQLRSWLEARRAELADQVGLPLPRPVPGSSDTPPDLSEFRAEVDAVAADLLKGVPASEAERDEAQQARWLLAQLLSWHRREEASSWWRYFFLIKLTDAERVAERDALGSLEYVGDLGPMKESRIHQYRFPEQEHAIRPGTEVYDPVTEESAGKVVEVDDVNCTINLSRGTGNLAPHPASLVPRDRVSAKALQESLLRIGRSVASHGINGKGPYRAARDLLLRLPPRSSRPEGAPLLVESEETVQGAVRLALDLDESTLPIQGPPGSGKTYAGAQIVLGLVAAGRKVGVTATSHKVIGHLLDEILDQASKAGQEVRVGQKTDKDGEQTCVRAQGFKDNRRLLEAFRGARLDVVGGTPWLWARGEFTGAVDVLVVDEAGQVSLANALAVAPAAKSLVLLGDPQQLNQPLKGSHPRGAEGSVLSHVLRDAATIEPDRGLFLASTWRLHPDLCALTSELFYEGRLTSRPGLECQALEGPTRLSGTGIRYIAVPHSGNQSESPEEADVIEELVDSLLASETYWTNQKAERRRITTRDIVIVAPYNDQVAQIARRLPGTRVGTVDKFQGQEAAISIYSMTTSSAAEAPRGMEFLYSLNRLNVATSRARCLSVVVASPDLMRVRCHTPRQMRLANALCRLVEMAAPTE